MALFRLLLLRTISSAKFSSSKTNLYGLPFVYQNTSALSYFTTPLAFHMWRIDFSPVQPSPKIELHKIPWSGSQYPPTGSTLLGTVSQRHYLWSVLWVLKLSWFTGVTSHAYHCLKQAVRPYTDTLRHRLRTLKSKPLQTALAVWTQRYGHRKLTPLFHQHSQGQICSHPPNSTNKACLPTQQLLGKQMC